MKSNEMVKLTGIAGKAILVFLLLCSTVFLSACGGSKLLKNSVPVTLTTPLEQVSDPQVTAALQWVIVRDGPGSWASYANWDEYLLSINNQTGEEIRITGVQVVDSTGYQLSSNPNRSQLVRESKETIQRYKEIDVNINAGFGGGAAMIAAGVGAGYLGSAMLSVGVEAALLGGATATSATLVAASAAIIVAPILIVGGIMQGVNNHEVANEIVARHSALPVTVAANETIQLNLFFPLAPSPQRIDIRYSGTFGTEILAIDTNEILGNLHVVLSQTDADSQLDRNSPVDKNFPVEDGAWADVEADGTDIP